MSIRLLASMRIGWMVVLIAAVMCPSAYAEGGSGFVYGEALVSVSAGTARSVVDAMAQSAGAKVVSKFAAVDAKGLVDVYLVRKTGAPATVTATTEMVATLKAQPSALYVHPNKIRRIYGQSGGTSTPNDPRYAEQWALAQVRMPEAWFLEKGQATATVCIIDTGVDIDHPEFKGRFDDGYNAQTGTSDPRPTDPTVDTHGTHVAGIAIAQANNSVGIAGMSWENVRLLPINAGDESGFPVAAELAAYAYILQYQAKYPNQKIVVNMSYGSDDTSDTPDLTDPSNAAIMNMASKGIIAVIAAGNSGDTGNPAQSPANLAPLSDKILCVAASNHLGRRSYFSSYRSTTTITAPGGDDIAGKMILSTLPLAAGSYGDMQGTSMAAPCVTGAIGLLLSVPGVTTSQVKGILTSTARPVSGYAVPSPEYGYGIMDVAAALAKVAVGVTVAAPQGTGGKADTDGTASTDAVETLKPQVVVQVAQIKPEDLTITIDGTVATDYTIENVTSSSKSTTGVVTPLSYQAVFSDRVFSTGTHSVVVSGAKGSITVTDTRNFVITPHQFTSGRAMVSIPYFESGATPEKYLGSDFRLARWVPGSGYAYYGSLGQKNSGASFTGTGVAIRSDGDPSSTAYLRGPVGLAYFTDFESVKPILTEGTSLASKSFVIPLKGVGSGNVGISWNMIGDPFPFDVPFNALLVDTGTTRLTIAEAVEQGYLLSSIYSYTTADGYSYRSLPNGTLKAWQGHWIAVTSQRDIDLIVPPSKVSRASVSKSGPVVENGWSLRISASAGSLSDTYNYIGVSSRAADVYDASDVVKPPSVSPYVSVGMSNEGWGKMAGLYAQDIRGASGTKTWSVVVNTDVADSDVTVRWTNGGTLPRGVKLMLKDETTGQVVDMRARSFVTFHSGADGATTRRYTVTSRASTNGMLCIRNLNVRSNSRSSGSAAISFTLTSDATTYTVGVKDATGKMVNTLASRAGTAGDVRMVWAGVDKSGRKLPAGAYMVEVRAVSGDGDAVTATWPFMLIR